MHLSRRTKIQFAIFSLIALVTGVIMLVGFMRVPAMAGIGHYTVTVELSEAAGLYPRANVTYRGTEVGLVDSVDLTDTGVTAVLSLKSDVSIPADLQAEVHSQTAIGEQYVALLPRGAAQPLKNGDVIPLNRTTVPPDINALISATNRGLQAIPRENLKTVIDESFTAVGGLGPELSRIVKGSTQLAIDARDNLDSMVSLIDQSGPLLDSQTETSDSVSAWASNLANITGQLKDQDRASPTDSAGGAGQFGQRGSGRRDLPAGRRATVGAAPAGGANGAGPVGNGRRHEAALCGLQLGLQPEPQLAAGMYDRVPARSTAAHASRGR
jgi:phospholipid/cholesterol/gamma-HCH transport system substrate-binding protein